MVLNHIKALRSCLFYICHLGVMLTNGVTVWAIPPCVFNACVLIAFKDLRMELQYKKAEKTKLHFWSMCFLVSVYKTFFFLSATKCHKLLCNSNKWFSNGNASS